MKECLKDCQCYQGIYDKFTIFYFSHTNIPKIVLYSVK